ncbi:uncharacterized protein RCC_05241 [Ramularia collo-cygni]|uniref:Uncharacterized protein n=1 Tax=Ramularia collo-cygni TaxID=112498 RepID=A0A2D3UQX5_9PEZI|nr:uncharacterized protein RCC_05241 [Ramularia collo-cygni]CZT19392.1 uncharacterized protein RCC_05241 [Ramularia collo-cygni]
MPSTNILARALSSLSLRKSPSADPLPKKIGSRHRRDTPQQSLRQVSSRTNPSGIFHSTPDLSPEGSITSQRIGGSSDHSLQSPHPRERYTTQQNMDCYLYRDWRREGNPHNLNSITLSSPNQNPSEQRRNDREPIPPEERNFYCTNTQPVEFAFGTGEKECDDSHDELTEAHMRSRWKGDYVHRNQRVEEWWVEVPDEVEAVEIEGADWRRERGKIGKGLGKARAKFVGVGRGLGRKCKGALEGNALV